MSEQDHILPPEPDLEELQRRLGVRLKNPALLRHALVHKSLTNDLGESGLLSNERLEFLGDSVLGMLVSEQLFRAYPDRDEGQLTLLRSALVRASSLAGWARELDLGAFVLVGRGESRAGGRNRDALLSSAFEAVLGAVFIDRGFRAARQLVQRFVQPELVTVGERQVVDAKSRLQQVSQARFSVTPTYEVLDVSGAGHSPIFTVRVIAGGGVSAEAVGRSKQSAQQIAAAEALATIEAMPVEPPAEDGAEAAELALTPGSGEALTPQPIDLPAP
ncbi:MAG: ribonuclease III [Chloroflexi bacterium]|nr:ribonuclease III [Chloroflexota bacterium]